MPGENNVQTPVPSQDGFNVDQAMDNMARTGSADAPPTPEQIQEYEFSALGKTIKAPIDKVLKYASQGYDYAQKMGEMNQMKERLKSLERWDVFQKTAEENPEWAAHVNKMWEERDRVLAEAHGADPNDPMIQRISGIEKKLSEALEFIQSSKQEREYQALTAEEESIRKQYADIDFDLVDDTGKSLAMRVLDHAKEQGIRSFRTAFRDFYHDHLVKRHEDRAKEEVVRTTRAQRRSGVVATNQVPREDAWMEETGLNFSY